MHIGLKMQKKGFNLSLETIIILIIVIAVLTLIVIFILRNYTNIFESFYQQTNATTALARDVTKEAIIPKP